MSYLLSFWPVKSFLTYVLSRSVGKYLKNKIDFSNYDLHQKKITFKDLELNTQMINENLKDSPFKVMQINLGSVQINNPSLNLLSSKISLELANVEVILMPVLNVDESKVKSQQEQNIQQEDGEEEGVYKSQEVKEVQKSEEYNILSNLFNKILSNLEVKITTISIKLLTRDVDLDETKDIPTFMLRLTNIEYKRSAILDPSTRPISDWQVILDGKTLDLGEVSLHLLPSCFIDQQREKLRFATTNVPGQNMHTRLKHPSEYPQINHYSTIFVIKPSVQQQVMFRDNKLQSINSSQIQTTGCMAGISVSMSFPSCSPPSQAHQSNINDKQENQLLLKIQIPSMESICSYDQLKTITKFAKEIELYKQQREGSAPLPTLKSQKQSKDVIGLELLSAKIKNGTLTDQELKQVHEKAIKAYKQSLDDNKKKEKERMKDPLKKEKKEKKERDMIIKFIKLTQKKSEFKQLQDNLKQSSHFMSGQREETKNEYGEGLSESQLLMTSTFQSESGRKSPLSVQVEFVLNKVSLIFLLHDSTNSYDRIYDSVQLPPTLKPMVPGLNAFATGSSDSSQQFQWFNILNEENNLFTRQHQTFGCSHYNFESRDFKVSLKLTHFKRRQKSRSQKSSTLTSQHFKQFELSAHLTSSRLSRYDLSQQPNHRLLKLIGKTKGGVNVNPNYFQGYSSMLGTVVREDSNESASLDQSSAQYESFSNSSMFQSANEFYKLDQSITTSSISIIDKSQAQQLPTSNIGQWSEPGIKKRHGGGGGGQGQINKESQHQSAQLNAAESFSYSNFHQQPILFGNVYLVNPYSQHFCRETVFSLKRLRNQEHH